MRIIHILTAVLLFSLFAVVLYTVSTDSLLVLDPDIDLEDDSNITNLFSSNASGKGINIIGETGESASDLADGAPGGIDSQVASSDSLTSDAALEQGSVGTVVSAGRMLYTIPKEMFSTIGTFLHIDSRFITVAIILLITLIATILVSSILKNRL